MKDRIFLFLLIAAGIISMAELFVILTTISPLETSTGVLWLFFICLFFSISTILSLLWHPLRSFIHHRQGLPRWISVRQASLVSLVIVLIIFFKSLGILTLWDSVPLVFSIILIEFFFQADKIPKNTP